MAIDFPQNPAIGQTVGLGDLLYTWDGIVWRVSGGTGGGFDAGLYLPFTGGTMTGYITLHADPVAPMHAATKQYVDWAAAQPPPTATQADMVAGVINDKFATPFAVMGLTGLQVTALNTANKTLVPAINELKMQVDFLTSGGSFVGSFNATNATIVWTAESGQSANELPPPAVSNKGWYLIADKGGTNPPAGAPAATYGAGDWLISDGTQWRRMAFGDAMVQVIASAVTVNPPVEGQNNVQSALETISATKVVTSGLVAPEQIVLFEGGTGKFIKSSGKTIAELTAELKAYADAQDLAFVKKTGDTMTGALSIPLVPAADAHAASKKYVDDKIADAGSGEAVHVVGPELIGDGLAASPVTFTGITADTATFTGNGLSVSMLRLAVVDGGTF